MVSLINKGLSTITNDGLKVLALRIARFSIVKLKRLTRKENVINLQKWKSLEGKYAGKRIFIIGNGPSLNATPLHLLKNDYTMCFNRFNLMFERIGWKPSFYMVTDDLVIKDIHKEINEDILPKVQYAIFPDIHPSNVEFTKYIEQRDNVLWIKTDIPEFRSDLPNCGINLTVVNAGLQVAAFLGFAEIFLVGVDMNFSDQKVKKITARDWEASEQDPNHFDPRYFGKGKKYHNPAVNDMIIKFYQGKSFFDKLNVKIFNAGIGGNLEAFPRVAFSTLFNYSESEKEGFLGAIEVLKEYNITVCDLKNSPIITDFQQSLPSIFQAPADIAISQIPKLILSYIPLGPYENTCYFILRK